MALRTLTRAEGGFHLEFTQSGTSDAIVIPKGSPRTAVLLSKVVGGDAIVEYSLSLRPAIEAGTAIWHEWSIGIVTPELAEGGTVFDGPTGYIRVMAAEGVSYILEARS